MKIAHIINPVKKEPESDLFLAQPITFKSMVEAKNYVNHCIKIELLSTFFEEDDIEIPSKIKKLNNLKKSVLDIRRFQKKRRLPLIKEIFDIAINSSDADFLIYTNVDISLMPFFYDYIAEKIAIHDAFVINRRTIEMPEYSDIPLSFLYSQIGKNHPGYDCFIFDRKLYEKFIFGNACIGANWIGRILICNLIAFSNNFVLLKDTHLTFHLGDERSWKTAENIEYDEHNENELRKLMIKIKNYNLLTKHSLLEQTYEEFVLNVKDPDPSRPKRVSKIEKLPNAYLDISLLYKKYQPSSSWVHRKDNILKQDPVFIVGYPRSGTTLLQSLVATQFATAVFPETHFFSIIRSMLKLNKDRIQGDCLNDIIKFMKDKFYISHQLEKYFNETTHAGELSPKMLFESIVFGQLARHAPISEIPNVNWIEKTPEHIYHLDTINRYYPEAKIIYVLRNPEKAILSRRKHFTWNDEVNWPIQKHIEKWIDSIKIAEKFEFAHPDSFKLVKFENILENTEDELRKICSFLKIEFKQKLIKNYKKFSEQQSLPTETWKNDTKNNISKNVSTTKGEFLNTKDRNILFELAGHYLKKYSYMESNQVGLRINKKLLIFNKLFSLLK